MTVFSSNFLFFHPSESFLLVTLSLFPSTPRQGGHMKVSRCLDRVLLFFPIGSYSLTLIHISVTFGKSLIKFSHIFLIYKIG